MFYLPNTDPLVLWSRYSFYLSLVLFHLCNLSDSSSQKINCSIVPYPSQQHCFWVQWPDTFLWKYRNVGPTPDLPNHNIYFNGFLNEVRHIKVWEVLLILHTFKSVFVFIYLLKCFFSPFLKINTVRCGKNTEVLYHHFLLHC